MSIVRDYRITGMHCAACEATVRKALMLDPDVLDVKADAATGAATITSLREVAVEKLRALVAKTGTYALTDPIAKATDPMGSVHGEPVTRTSPYRPLIIIGLFILGTSLLAQFPFARFDGMLWMRHFMAGFFLVFSFFKLLDVRGFALSYAMYDVVARRWKAWGFLYPFVELSFGVLFLTGLLPQFAAWSTLLVMGISAVGPIESVWNKKRIQCACLGAVFELPMSTVTIVEDLLMVAMAAGMLAST